MDVVDLRSDTVTKPGPAMRQAMAMAEVGDDIYGEDPTSRRLEARVAEILGKEAALYVPTGTMSNQIALAIHCRPGEDVVVGEHAHCVLYESGASSAIAGVQFTVAGSGGMFDAEALDAAIYPHAFYHPRTRLVALENTHNRSGGRVWPLAQLEAVCAHARVRGLATHLDGARLWNAVVASGTTAAVIAKPFDTISVCFSKGLGAPVGSAIVGSKDAIAHALHMRKRLGGGMRQVGVIAAGALYALEHHSERLVEDHQNAQVLAHGLAGSEGFRLDPHAIETNIVNVETDDAPAVAAFAKSRGVLVSAFGPTSIRAVTHLDVSAQGIHRAIEVLVDAVNQH